MVIKTILGLAFISILGCANTQSNLNNKKEKVIDKRFVGIFNGSNKDKQTGGIDTCQMNRKGDGT